MQKLFWLLPYWLNLLGDGLDSIAEIGRFESNKGLRAYLTWLLGVEDRPQRT